MKHSFLKTISSSQRLSQAAFLSVSCLFATSVWTQALADNRFAAAPSGAIAQATTTLPQTIRTAVVNAAATRTGLPISQIEVVEAEPRDWPDGCLGLAEPGVACTQAIVPGWRVVVSANQQELVYRTNQSGGQIRLAQGDTTSGGDPTFTDIANHWARSCIQRLSQDGVISGYPNNTFRPNSPISRAEYAALINQAFPEVAANRNPVTFTDVPVYYWGQDAIQTAYSKGFLSGYPNQQFRPNELISRVETYVALASGLNYETPAMPEAVLSTAYGDAGSIPSYATGAIAAATQQGIIVNENPQTTAFDPTAPATRAQVAATLCQIKYDDAGVSAGYEVDQVESPDRGNTISLGQTCENTASGFTVAYPTGWMTNSGEVTERCYVFDPQSITLPEQSSSLDEAIHMRVDNVSYTRATRQDDPTERQISRRETMINGREAIVTESISTGRGLIPADVSTYTYIINLGNSQILVASTYDYAGQPYERNKQVLDQMVDTLSFQR